MASASIVWEIEDEFWFRWLGAAGVLDASSTLALLILAKLRKVGQVQKLQTAAGQVELRCPRCTTGAARRGRRGEMQRMRPEVRIEIEEPRCAKCDYLLWQLPERPLPGMRARRSKSAGWRSSSWPQAYFTAI